MKRGRQPDPRRASIHRSYSIAEVAKLFGVHRNTVDAWLKAGLRSFMAGRTRLILGEDLRAFLQARQRQRREPLRPGEMRCLPCRRSRSPDPALVDWASRNRGRGGKPAWALSVVRLSHASAHQPLGTGRGGIHHRRDAGGFTPSRCGSFPREQFNSRCNPSCRPAQPIPSSRSVK